MSLLLRTTLQQHMPQVLWQVIIHLLILSWFSVAMGKRTGSYLIRAVYWCIMSHYQHFEAETSRHGCKRRFVKYVCVLELEPKDGDGVCSMWQ